MDHVHPRLTRRQLLRTAGIGAAGLALAGALGGSPPAPALAGARAARRRAGTPGRTCGSPR